MSKIKFKHIRIGKFYFSNAYSIYTGKMCIDEINFKKQNNIFIIAQFKKMSYTCTHICPKIINKIF